MLKYCKVSQNLDLAGKLFEQMKLRVSKADISLFLDESTLKWIGSDISFTRHTRRETDTSEVPEFIEEEIE
jgi:hypothetical protein